MSSNLEAYKKKKRDNDIKHLENYSIKFGIFFPTIFNMSYSHNLYFTEKRTLKTRVSDCISTVSE